MVYQSLTTKLILQNFYYNLLNTIILKNILYEKWKNYKMTYQSLIIKFILQNFSHNLPDIVIIKTTFSSLFEFEALTLSP